MMSALPDGDDVDHADGADGADIVAPMVIGAASERDQADEDQERQDGDRPLPDVHLPAY
jgi:hypothetical protein